MLCCSSCGSEVYLENFCLYRWENNSTPPNDKNVLYILVCTFIRGKKKKIFHFTHQTHSFIPFVFKTRFFQHKFVGKLKPGYHRVITRIGISIRRQPWVACPSQGQHRDKLPCTLAPVVNLGRPANIFSHCDTKSEHLGQTSKPHTKGPQARFRQKVPITTAVRSLHQ